MQELLTDKVAQIESKVRQLAAKLQTLQRENERLKGDYKALQSEMIQKNTKLLALEKQTKILPLAQN